MAHFVIGWVPDGSALVTGAAEPNGPVRCSWMDLNGKSRVITPSDVNPVAVTRDGKFLLAQDPDSNYVYYPLAGGDSKPFPAKMEIDDRIVAFEPDGKSLLVYKRGVPARIFRVSLETSQRELVKEVSPSDIAGVQAVSSVLFSADRKSYAYTYYRVLSDLWVVDGLK
jgi:WD40 repeat protein